MLIFLDFDGVLHTNVCHAHARLFSQIPIFESFFRQPKYWHCEFVISSTWRIHRDLNELAAPFSPDFRHRIIGVTPILPHSGSLKGSREREILAWLRDFRREHEAWLALDDMYHYFDAHVANVFFCTGKTGLTEQDLPDLATHLMRVQMATSGGI